MMAAYDPTTHARAVTRRALSRRFLVYDPLHARDLYANPPPRLGAASAAALRAPPPTSPGQPWAAWESTAEREQRECRDASYRREPLPAALLPRGGACSDTPDRPSASLLRHVLRRELGVAGRADGAPPLSPSPSPPQLPLAYGRCRRVPWHTGCVNAVAFSPCGDWAATGGDDCRVALWAVAQLSASAAAADTPHTVYLGHSANVFCVAFSPCGRWLLSCGADGLVMRHRVVVPAPPPAPPQPSAAVRGAGAAAATAAAVAPAAGGQPVHVVDSERFVGHRSCVYRVDFVDAGGDDGGGGGGWPRFVSVGDDGVRLWDARRRHGGASFAATSDGDDDDGAAGFVGPAAIADGRACCVGRIVCSSAVSGLAVHPTHRHLFVVGADRDGVAAFDARVAFDVPPEPPPTQPPSSSSARDPFIRAPAVPLATWCLTHRPSSMPLPPVVVTAVASYSGGLAAAASSGVGAEGHALELPDPPSSTAAPAGGGGDAAPVPKRRRKSATAAAGSQPSSSSAAAAAGGAAAAAAAPDGGASRALRPAVPPAALRELVLRGEWHHLAWYNADVDGTAAAAGGWALSEGDPAAGQSPWVDPNVRANAGASVTGIAFNRAGTLLVVALQYSAPVVLRFDAGAITARAAAGAAAGGGPPCAPPLFGQLPVAVCQAAEYQSTVTTKAPTFFGTRDECVAVGSEDNAIYVWQLPPALVASAPPQLPAVAATDSDGGSSIIAALSGDCVRGGGGDSGSVAAYALAAAPASANAASSSTAAPESNLAAVARHLDAAAEACYLLPQPVATLRGHAAVPNALAHHPRLPLLLSAGVETALRLWSPWEVLIRGGRLLPSEEPPGNDDDRQLVKAGAPAQGMGARLRAPPAGGGAAGAAAPGGADDATDDDDRWSTATHAGAREAAFEYGRDFAPPQARAYSLMVGEARPTVLLHALRLDATVAGGPAVGGAAAMLTLPPSQTALATAAAPPRHASAGGYADRRHRRSFEPSASSASDLGAAPSLRELLGEPAACNWWHAPGPAFRGGGAGGSGGGRAAVTFPQTWKRARQAALLLTSRFGPPLHLLRGDVPEPVAHRLRSERLCFVPTPWSRLSPVGTLTEVRCGETPDAVLRRDVAARSNPHDLSSWLHPYGPEPDDDDTDDDSDDGDHAGDDDAEDDGSSDSTSTSSTTTTTSSSLPPPDSDDSEAAGGGRLRTRGRHVRERVNELATNSEDSVDDDDEEEDDDDDGSVIDDGSEEETSTDADMMSSDEDEDDDDDDDGDDDDSDGANGALDDPGPLEDFALLCHRTGCDITAPLRGMRFLAEVEADALAAARRYAPLLLGAPQQLQQPFPSSSPIVGRKRSRAKLAAAAAAAPAGGAADGAFRLLPMLPPPPMLPSGCVDVTELLLRPWLSHAAAAAEEAEARPPPRPVRKGAAAKASQSRPPVPGLWDDVLRADCAAADGEARLPPLVLRASASRAAVTVPPALLGGGGFYVQLGEGGGGGRRQRKAGVPAAQEVLPTWTALLPAPR